MCRKMIREDIEEIRKNEEQNKKLGELNLKLAIINTIMCFVIMINGLINVLHILNVF